MKTSIFLKTLGIMLTIVLLFFIPLLVSGGDLGVYFTFFGIFFIIVGTIGMVAVLFIVVKYVSKIPDRVEIDYDRNILRLVYGRKKVELPYKTIQCVDLSQYLKSCHGCIYLPNLIAGRFKTINNEYVSIYSESSKGVLVVTCDGRKLVYTAPRELCG